MHILIALNDQRSRETLQFMVESKHHAQVTSCDTEEKAKTALLGDHGIGLVVCQYPENADGICTQLRAYPRKIPIVVCAQVTPTSAIFMKNGNVIGILDLATLADTIGSVIETYRDSFIGSLNEPKATASESPHDAPQELDQMYCRIRTSLLVRCCPLRAPVYVRLSAKKYVKYYNTGDSFDPNDQEKFEIGKKMPYLFLRSGDTQQFSVKLREELQGFAEAGYDTPEIAIESSTSVHETVQELIQKIGPTTEIQQTVKSAIQASMKTMAKNKDLKALMGRLVADRSRYIASHSIFLGSVASTIAAAMEWKTSQTLVKLNLAAFLHDIAMTNQQLAMVDTIEELNLKSALFTQKELDGYRTHPLVGADLARRFSEVPPDVDAIIAQHHERPDGSGFPYKLIHTRMGPLAGLFIVAHDLVHEIYRREGDFEMNVFIHRMAPLYNRGHFKKVLTALETVKF